MSISKYRPQRRNANKHTQRGLRMLEDSIQRDGWIGGITVAADGETFDGSARLETLANVMPDAEPIVVETNGQTPVIIKRTDIPNADDPRAKRLAIVANHSAAVDLDWDAAILAEIARDDAIVKAIAQEDAKLRELLKAEQKGETTDAGELIDKAAQLQEKWQVKRGDIWQIGKHRLMCGDSTSQEDVATLMQGEKWAIIFTDPPYGIKYDTTASGRSKRDWGKIANDELEGESLIAFNVSFLTAALPHATENASLYVCSANRTAHLLVFAAERLGLHYAVPLVWVKQHFSLNWDRYHPQHEMIFYGGEGSKPTGALSRWFGGKNESTVWQIDRDNSSDYEHPTQKPVALPARAIQNSTQEGEVILDQFCGSGTTLVACEQMGRVGRGMEIEPKYCAVALERLSLLGLTPTRAGG